MKKETIENQFTLSIADDKGNIFSFKQPLENNSNSNDDDSNGKWSINVKGNKFSSNNISDTEFKFFEFTEKNENKNKKKGSLPIVANFISPSFFPMETKNYDLSIFLFSENIYHDDSLDIFYAPLKNNDCDTENKFKWISKNKPQYEKNKGFRELESGETSRGNMFAVNWKVLNEKDKKWLEDIFIARKKYDEVTVLFDNTIKHWIKSKENKLTYLSNEKNDELNNKKLNDSSGKISSLDDKGRLILNEFDVTTKMTTQEGWVQVEKNKLEKNGVSIVLEREPHRNNHYGCKLYVKLLDKRYRDKPFVLYSSTDWQKTISIANSTVEILKQEKNEFYLGKLADFDGEKKEEYLKPPKLEPIQGLLLIPVLKSEKSEFNLLCFKENKLQMNKKDNQQNNQGCRMYENYEGNSPFCWTEDSIFDIKKFVVSPGPEDALLNVLDKIKQALIDDLVDSSLPVPYFESKFNAGDAKERSDRTENFLKKTKIINKKTLEYNYKEQINNPGQTEENIKAVSDEWKQGLISIEKSAKEADFSAWNKKITQFNIEIEEILSTLPFVLKNENSEKISASKKRFKP